MDDKGKGSRHLLAVTLNSYLSSYLQNNDDNSTQSQDGGYKCSMKYNRLYTERCYTGLVQYYNSSAAFRFVEDDN